MTRRDFEQLVKQALAEVSMYKNKDYNKVFLSEDVTRARNNWHKAANRVDETRRIFGEFHYHHDDALKDEDRAHDNYLKVKNETKILEKDNEDE